MTHTAASSDLWTAAIAARAVGGVARGDAWAARGVAIDSRTVAPGDLFIALKGPSFDGHDFVAQALAAGAAAACVSRVEAAWPASAPLLVVPDTFRALEELGRAGRDRSRARVVAITGSVGKTGTKEALAQCLGEQGRVFATAGNLNNHWGVPLSLARLPVDAEFGVFELGMNHAGEIGPLSRLVRPDVALITTIAPAHLGHFASVEAIADAKGEIFEGMGPNGTVLLNRDNLYTGRLLAEAQAHGLSRLWTFGSSPGCDAQLVTCSLDATSSSVTALVRGEQLDYCISVPGKHWVINSLAILLAVHAVGGDPVTGARALSRLKPVKGRGNRLVVVLADGCFTIVDESYNASPVAMEAAFQVLGRMEPEAGGRRIAVLGDMLELGDESVALHAGLAEGLTAAGVDLVFAAGPHMAALMDRLPAARFGGHAADSTALAGLVTARVGPGDVVLVKGSAGSRMGVVVAALQRLSAESGQV